MQVSVETTEGLGRRMKIQVPSDRVDTEVQRRLQDLSHRVRLDGFRPGKVPFKVVQKRYGSQVRQEVMGEVIQSTYAEAMQQEKLHPAGAPEIEPIQMDSGKDLEYVAMFEVMPDFELQGVEGMKLERPAPEIKDADVERVLEDLRKQQVSYEEVKRKAKADDRVTIDFVGEVEGKPFEGNEGKDTPVVIGGDQMPPEFESQLKGMKAGEKKDIEYVFPEEFPTPEIAGKTAVFHVEVTKVEGPKMPELDDDFAEQLGIKEGGIEAVRAKIRENVEREAARTVQAKLKEQVMDALVEANPIDVPKALVDSEIEALQNQARQRMEQYGQANADLDLPASLFEDQAVRRVKLGLVINQIISKYEIKADQAAVDQKLDELVGGYEQADQVKQYYRQNQQLMEQVEIGVLEDEVVDFCVEKAKVKDKKVDFETLMKGDQEEETEGNSKSKAKSKAKSKDKADSE